jgi:hypothetical protein
MADESSREPPPPETNLSDQASQRATRQSQTDREARVGRTSQVPVRTRSPAPVSSGFVKSNVSQAADPPDGLCTRASHHIKKILSMAKGRESFSSKAVAAVKVSEPPAVFYSSTWTVGQLTAFARKHADAGAWAIFAKAKAKSAKIREVDALLIRIHDSLVHLGSQRELNELVVSMLEEQEEFMNASFRSCTTDTDSASLVAERSAAEKLRQDVVDKDADEDLQQSELINRNLDNRGAHPVREVAANLFPIPQETNRLPEVARPDEPDPFDGWFCNTAQTPFAQGEFERLAGGGGSDVRSPIGSLPKATGKASRTVTFRQPLEMPEHTVRLSPPRGPRGSTQHLPPAKDRSTAAELFDAMTAAQGDTRCGNPEYEGYPHQQFMSSAGMNVPLEQEPQYSSSEAIRVASDRQDREDAESRLRAHSVASAQQHEHRSPQAPTLVEQDPAARAPSVFVVSLQDICKSPSTREPDGSNRDMGAEGTRFIYSNGADPDLPVIEGSSLMTLFVDGDLKDFAVLVNQAHSAVYDGCLPPQERFWEHLLLPMVTARGDTWDRIDDDGMLVKHDKTPQCPTGRKIADVMVACTVKANGVGGIQNRWAQDLARFDSHVGSLDN